MIKNLNEVKLQEIPCKWILPAETEIFPVWAILNNTTIEFKYAIAPDYRRKLKKEFSSRHVRTYRCLDWPVWTYIEFKHMRQGYLGFFVQKKLT